MERSKKRKATKDISYLQKPKKIKEDLNLPKKEYVCFLHDNERGICSIYDCSGFIFQTEDKEKKENKEYII
jgi:hypothetical protein